MSVATSSTKLEQSLRELSEDLTQIGAMAALCDRSGRLITFDGSGGAFEEVDGNLRAPARGRGEALGAMLARVPVATLLADGNDANLTVQVGGQDDLVALRTISRSQDWVVVLTIPERVLLADLNHRLDSFLLLGLGVETIILVGGVFTLTTIRGALRAIDRRTGELERFRFDPVSVSSPIRDVAAVLSRLELAKTAMRAMGHYVPIELVKRIYRSGREPALGGEQKTITILFSDIEGFTTISETLDPDQLAQALGVYLEVATDRVHEREGIVDKYIGDAVMALWNAPEDVEHHTRKACLTALDCVEANAALFASNEWQNLPPFNTRFGIHRADVVVGHFGSRERMSYTAVGDGVNLAARLEGLNKEYGTRILISDVARAELDAGFLVREVDRVAVKGKREPTAIFELLGHAPGAPAERVAELRQLAESYAAARALYLDARFVDAEHAFERLSDDPVAQVMAARCRQYRAVPPSQPWDGVWRATTK